MRYVEPGEEGYNPKRTLLVELDGDDLGQIATLTVKRPAEKHCDPDNYVVPNGAERDGAVPSKWKDNAKFYEYLKHAPGAIVEVDRSRRSTEVYHQGGGRRLVEAARPQ